MEDRTGDSVLDLFPELSTDELGNVEWNSQQVVDDADAADISTSSFIATEDVVPVAVYSIQFLEVDTDFNVINQDSAYVRDIDFVDGTIFNYTSIVAKVDDNGEMGGEGRMPGGMNLVLRGVNAAGDPVRNVFTITYANDCGVPTFEDGDAIGWVVFVSFLSSLLHTFLLRFHPFLRRRGNNIPFHLFVLYALLTRPRFLSPAALCIIFQDDFVPASEETCPRSITSATDAPTTEPFPTPVTVVPVTPSPVLPATPSPVVVDIDVDVPSPPSPPVMSMTTTHEAGWWEDGYFTDSKSGKKSTKSGKKRAKSGKGSKKSWESSTDGSYHGWGGDRLRRRRDM
jgi:hypothetical protein